MAAIFGTAILALAFVWKACDSAFSFFGEAVGLPTIAGPENPELLADIRGTLSIVPGFFQYSRGQQINQVCLSSDAEWKSETDDGDIVAFDGPDEDGLCVYLLDSPASKKLSLMSFRMGSREPHREVLSNDAIRRSLVEFSSISLSRRGGHILVDLGRETASGTRRFCEYWRVGQGVVSVISEDHYPMSPKWLTGHSAFLFQRLGGEGPVNVRIIREDVETGEEVIVHETTSPRWGGWGSFIVDRSSSSVLIEQNGECQTYSGAHLAGDRHFTLPGALSSRAGPCLIAALSRSRLLYVAYPTAGKEMPPYGWGLMFPPSPAAIKVLDTDTGEFATVVPSFAYAQVAFSQFEF